MLYKVYSPDPECIFCKIAAKKSEAKIIFEKGFDNVYLLSGGYLIFSKENPDLIEGLMVERKLSLKR